MAGFCGPSRWEWAHAHGRPPYTGRVEKPFFEMVRPTCKVGRVVRDAQGTPRVVSLHTAFGVRDPLNTDVWQLDVYRMRPLLLMARVRGRYSRTRITEFVRAPDMWQDLASAMGSELYVGLGTDADTDRRADPLYSGALLAVVGDWAVPLRVPLDASRPGAPATVLLVTVVRTPKPECVETGRFVFFAVYHALTAQRKKTKSGERPHAALSDAMKVCETALVLTDLAPYGDAAAIDEMLRHVRWSVDAFQPRTLAQIVADTGGPRGAYDALVFVLQFLKAHHDPRDRDYAQLDQPVEEPSVVAASVVEALAGQSLTAIADHRGGFDITSVHSAGVDSRPAAASVGVHRDGWAQRVPLLCDETAPALARLLLTPPPDGTESEGSHARVQRAVADDASDEQVRSLYTDAYALSTVMPLIVRSTVLRHVDAVLTTHESFEESLDSSDEGSVSEITALAATLHEQLRVIALSCASLRVPPPAVAMDCTLFSGSARMRHCGLGRGAVHAEGPTKLCQAASRVLVAGQFGKRAVVQAAELLDPLYNWLRDTHTADESRDVHVVQIHDTVCTVEELRRLSELPDYEQRRTRRHLTMRVVEYLLAAAASVGTAVRRGDAVARPPDAGSLMREIDLIATATRPDGAAIARVTRGLAPLTLLGLAQELLAVLAKEGLTLHSHRKQLEAMLIWARMRAQVSAISPAGVMDDSNAHASATLGTLAELAASLVPPYVALDDPDVERYVHAVQSTVNSVDTSALRLNARRIADRTLQRFVLEATLALERLVHQLQDMLADSQDVATGRAMLAVHRQAWRRSRGLFAGAAAPLQRALHARREPQIQLMLRKLQRAMATEKNVAWGSTEKHVTERLVFKIQCAQEARVYSGLERVLPDPREEGEAVAEAEAARLLGPRVYVAVVRAVAAMDPVAAAAPRDRAAVLLNLRSHAALRRAAVRQVGAKSMPSEAPRAQPLAARAVYYAERWLRSKPGQQQAYYLHTLVRHVQALRSMGQVVPSFHGEGVPQTSTFCTVDTLPLLITAADVVRGAPVLIELIAPPGVSFNEIDLRGAEAPGTDVAFRMPPSVSPENVIGVVGNVRHVAERSVYDLDAGDIVCYARATVDGECMALVIDSRNNDDYEDEEELFTVDAQGNVSDRTWIRTMRPAAQPESQLTSSRRLGPDQTAETLQRIYTDACTAVSQDGNSMRTLLHNAAAGVLKKHAEREAASVRTDGADGSKPAQLRATAYATQNGIKKAVMAILAILAMYTLYTMVGAAPVDAAVDVAGGATIDIARVDVAPVDAMSDPDTGIVASLQNAAQMAGAALTALNHFAGLDTWNLQNHMVIQQALPQAVVPEDAEFEVESGSKQEFLPEQDGSPVDFIEAVSDELMGSAELADYLNDVLLDEDLSKVDPWQDIRRQVASMPPELPPLPDKRPVPDWDLLQAQFGHLRQFVQSNYNDLALKAADTGWEALRRRHDASAEYPQVERGVRDEATAWIAHWHKLYNQNDIDSFTVRRELTDAWNREAQATKWYAQQQAANAWAELTRAWDADMASARA